MKPLLTPKDVAVLLSVSVRTIYDNYQRLGGFYPAGIKRLRFREEVINGIMEGQKPEGLVLQVSSSEQTIRQPGLLYQKRGNSRQGGTSMQGSRKYRTDPKEHGL
jgi:hypothetical protein